MKWPMEREMMMVPTALSFVLQMPQSSTGNRSLTEKGYSPCIANITAFNEKFVEL